jgi:hypothetical protein
MLASPSAGVMTEEGPKMLRVPALTAAAVLAALLSACATTGGADKADYQPPVYRTGSNIPVRDPGAASSVQSVDPQSLDRMSRPGMPSTVRGN